MFLLKDASVVVLLSVGGGTLCGALGKRINGVYGERIGNGIGVGLGLTVFFFLISC